MKGVYVRPLQDGDWQLIDGWRRRYFKGDLEYPHGVLAPGVETLIATKNNTPIGALTGISAVVMDPFAHDPAASPSDLIYGLLKMETTLAYLGQKAGAVDEYIAVPASETHYIRLLQNYGFKPTVQGCVVLRRPLVPDVWPLLGDERDAAERQDVQASETGIGEGEKGARIPDEGRER